MEALNSLVNVILVLLFALLVAEITKPFARFWSGDSKHESLREELKDWWSAKHDTSGTSSLVE